jgi:hypothetical protein
MTDNSLGSSNLSNAFIAKLAIDKLNTNARINAYITQGMTYQQALAQCEADAALDAQNATSGSATTKAWLWGVLAVLTGIWTYASISSISTSTVQGWAWGESIFFLLLTTLFGYNMNANLDRPAAERFKSRVKAVGKKPSSQDTKNYF